MQHKSHDCRQTELCKSQTLFSCSTSDLKHSHLKKACCLRSNFIARNSYARDHRASKTAGYMKHVNCPRITASDHQLTKSKNSRRTADRSLLKENVSRADLSAGTELQRINTPVKIRSRTAHKQLSRKQKQFRNTLTRRSPKVSLTHK